MAAEISLGDQHEDQQVEFDLTLLYQSLCTSLKGFVISKHTCSDQPCLILTHEQLFNHPPFGLNSIVRILRVCGTCAVKGGSTRSINDSSSKKPSL